MHILRLLLTSQVLLHGTVNGIEIWLAQASHILKNYHFFLKSFSEIRDHEEKIYKKGHSFTIPSRVICHLSSHCNQQTICSIFIKTEGPSPEFCIIIIHRLYYIILFTDKPSSAILSALPFMDWCKERTDRHQPE